MGNTVSTSKTGRKQTADIPASVVEPALTLQPFPLLRLPPELRDLVYEQHYAGTLLHMCDCLNTLDCHGHPSLDLELTCREVSAEAKRVREKCFYQHLVIVANSFLNRTAEFHAEKFYWLRQHIRSIELILPDQPTEDVAWKNLLEACPNLREVHITILDHICPDHDLHPNTQLADDDGQFINIVPRTNLDRVARRGIPFRTSDLGQAFAELGRENWKVQTLVSIRISRCNLEQNDDEGYMATLDILFDSNTSNTQAIERACSSPLTYAYWSKGMTTSNTITTPEIEEIQDRYSQANTAFALSLSEQQETRRWVAERTRPRVIRNDDEVNERIQRQLLEATPLDPQNHSRLRKFVRRIRSLMLLRHS